MGGKISSMSFYGDEQRAFQATFETADLAAIFEATIINDGLDDGQQAFIVSQDHFFLSSVDGDGWPTVSYKGGPVGVVRVVDERTLEFPSYDGNGMFLSIGNIEASAKIGMLFIDTVTPRRLRVQATATVTMETDALAAFPGAQLVVRAELVSTWENCARYIHRHERVAVSKYIPDEAGEQPTASWKKIDMIQPFLSSADQRRVTEEGETITGEDYAARLDEGTS